MEYEVKSLLKIDNAFVPFETFNGKIPDNLYIEGAIEWAIGASRILTAEHWDLVDQLWAYLINGLLQLGKADTFETHFPDQPLLLRFSKIGRNMVRVEIGEAATVVGFRDMVYSLCEGGRKFFSQMNEIIPEFHNTWNEYLQKIKALESEASR